MDLKDMQCFCTIVEEGQISKAAKKLNISQPPLSLRLKEMERELGCTLILRTPGQWKVTFEGQALYHNCQQILSHANSLAETIRDANSRYKGQVRIGLGSHCVSFFQKILPTLMEQYPDISCRTVVADSPTIERYLQERAIELAVLRLNLSSNNCTTFNLPKQHLVAVYSHLIDPPARDDSVSFEELVRHPLLFSRRWADSDGFRPIMAAFQSKHLKPRMVLDTQMPSLLFELLYTTPAVAIMPNTEIPAYRSHHFPVRTIDHYVVFQPVVAYLSASYLTPQATAVLDLLKKQYEA